MSYNDGDRRQKRISRPQRRSQSPSASGGRRLVEAHTSPCPASVGAALVLRELRISTSMSWKAKRKARSTKSARCGSLHARCARRAVCPVGTCRVLRSPLLDSISPARLAFRRGASAARHHRRRVVIAVRQTPPPRHICSQFPVMAHVRLLNTARRVTIGRRAP